MKIIRNILIIIITIFFLQICFASENTLEQIDKESGKKRWIALNDFFLKTKTLYSPPNSTYIFEDKNILLSTGLLNSREKVEKKGKWLIDVNKGYFYFKVEHLFIQGFEEGKYKSFKIYCSESKGRKYCSIIFYTGSEFIETEDGEKLYGSGDYFQLSP